MTEEKTSTWEDVRGLVDQLKLELHLAGMEAREQWEKLQPRLVELEKSVQAGAHSAGSAISEQVSALGDTLKKLLADIKDKGKKLA